MATDRSRRVEKLFEQALRLPKGQRARFLGEQGADDPDLLDEVRSLLGHHSVEFLENSDHLPSSSERAGSDPKRIGVYRVVRPLGQGGMGVVYLAEQEHPVRRPVALKLIKLGMDTASVVARFEGERQTLAMMNHPNIAHVYDAGATERGRPYFVMEFIEDGTPITVRCDQHHLNIRERLELFLQVCEGLQHAHQKGVIHQDIKPSNVLVTDQSGSAVPKIIDFGIAKATEQHQAEATAFTELGQVVGTPEYMSPEQTDWTHPDIDTRSDVYSLGVLLYELLVGVRPFDSRKLGIARLDELYAVIREVDPPRPSARLRSPGEDWSKTAAARRTDPSMLVRQLKGDLDWIVLKAVAKDRERRYATALELAADIRRHLTHQPVRARPPGAGYRIGKFIRRHRIGVTAASIVMLAFVAGIIGTTMGMVQARRAAAVAREIEGFMVGAFEDADPSHSRGETITAREVLDTSATRVRQEFEAQPQVQGRLMLAIGQAYLGIGAYSQAEPLLRDAVHLLRESQGRNHPDVATALNGLANLLVSDQRHGDAVPLYEEALRIWSKAKEPDHTDLAVLLKNLGNAQISLGEFDRASTNLERAAEIFRARFGPDSLEVGKCLGVLGKALTSAGDLDAAIPILEQSLRIRERHAESLLEPAVGYGHWYLGDALLDAGHNELAAEHIRTALEMWIGIHHGLNQPQIGWFSFRLAEALEALSDLEAAEEYFRQAVRADELAYGAEAPQLVETLEGLAAFLRRRGRETEAVPLETRAAAIRQRKQQGRDP